MSEQVGNYVQRAIEAAAAAQAHNIYPVAWGFGRLDALGRGGNLVLEQLSITNIRPAAAPVSFPAVWDAYELDWVQWNGSIQQPLGRNMGEAIGVNAVLIITPGANQFKTSVSIKDLVEVETLVRELRRPPWPSDIFGGLDQEKLRRGKALYTALCRSCHDIGMTATNEYGKQFKKVKMVPLEEIGTDPVSAVSFNKRRVDTGALGLGELSAAQATEALTSDIIDRQFREGSYTESQKAAMAGYRKNNWRAPLAYMARPHSGVWTLAPYLHNGSVPNLYELLSPQEERSTVFYVGNLEFDPKKVGFVSGEAPNTFKFDTTLDGNKNTGHEFRDGPIGNGVIGRALSEQERYDLIEYLKTL